MPTLPWAVIAIIAIAYLFDFLNGMHDAANSIATVVSTRVLSPRAAVIWAAFFNFAAAFGLGAFFATGEWIFLAFGAAGFFIPDAIFNGRVRARDEPR